MTLPCFCALVSHIKGHKQLQTTEQSSLHLLPWPTCMNVCRYFFLLHAKYVPEDMHPREKDLFSEKEGKKKERLFVRKCQSSNALLYLSDRSCLDISPRWCESVVQCSFGLDNRSCVVDRLRHRSVMKFYFVKCITQQDSRKQVFKTTAEGFFEGLQPKRN